MRTIFGLIVIVATMLVSGCAPYYWGPGPRYYWGPGYYVGPRYYGGPYYHCGWRGRCWYR